MAAAVLAVSAGASSLAAEAAMAAGDGVGGSAPDENTGTRAARLPGGGPGTDPGVGTVADPEGAGEGRAGTSCGGAPGGACPLGRKRPGRRRGGAWMALLPGARRGSDPPAADCSGAAAPWGNERAAAASSAPGARLAGWAVWSGSAPDGSGGCVAGQAGERGDAVAKSSPGTGRKPRLIWPGVRPLTPGTRRGSLPDRSCG
jgi:hypothetical protein